jgi:hypothetical protein
MNTRAWMLMGTLLALPALAQEQPAAKPPAAPAATAAQVAPAQPKPTFDLRNTGVQNVIRANAAKLQASGRADPSDGISLFADTPPQTGDTKLQDIPFRAPRRLHHMDCDSYNCVAYTADNQALYAISREQYFGINTDDSKEAWLSCQSGNDLLTTFERYDKCRGVSIGLPLPTHDVIVNLPKLRL